MKPVVFQALLPIRYQTHKNGKPISSAEVRRRLTLFLQNNMTDDLAQRRDTFISDQHRLEFRAPCDFQDPSFKKSVRLESILDAKLAEYAGVMQLNKRAVVWMAVALHDSQYPAVLPLKEVLRQTGDVTPSFIDFHGRVRPLTE